MKKFYYLLMLLLAFLVNWGGNIQAQTNYDIDVTVGKGSVVVNGTTATVTISTDNSYGTGGIFNAWLVEDGNLSKLDGVTTIKFVTEENSYLASEDLTCIEKLSSVTEIDASGVTLVSNKAITIDGLSHVEKLNLSKVTSKGITNLSIKSNSVLKEIDMSDASFTEMGWDPVTWDFSQNPELVKFNTQGLHAACNRTGNKLNLGGDEKLIGFDASFGAQTNNGITPFFEKENAILPDNFKYFISGDDSNITIDVIQHGGLIDAFDVLPTDFTYNKISVNGDLGDWAIERLNGFDCKQFDMGNATLATSNYTFSFKGNEHIENVVLPKDIPAVKAEWFEGCTNLNAAISMSTDGTSASAYVNKAGSFKELTQNSKLVTVDDKITDWTISGHLKNVDIRPTFVSGKYGAVNSTATDDGEGTGALGQVVNSFDLTNAVFEDGEMTFNQYQKYLTSVKLPTSEKMTKIPDYCMNGCTQITVLEIPGNYDGLGAHAFEGMSALNKATLGPGVRTLGDHCFSMCTSLTQISLPVGMTTVGAYSFDGCKALKDLMIPYGVETIEEGAFYNLDALTSVRLPYTLKTIGKYAFKDCNGIETITIPENVELIDEGAFSLTNSLRDIYVLGKKAPKIVDYKPASGEDPAVEGSFDGMTLTNEYGTFNGDEGTQDKYWRGGKGAAFLHFPKGCEDQYTDKERNDAYSAYLVDETGVKIKDEDGKFIMIPTGKDGVNVTDWSAKYSGWKSFMLAVANQTGDDNSSVWTVRHMYDDTWYTMCFPFDLTINQLVSTFGAGFEIAYFCGVEKSANGSIVLQFTESNYMKDADYSRIGAAANVPYMIHPNSGVGNSVETGKTTKFVFTGVSPDYTNGPIAKTGYDYGGDEGTGPGEDPNNPNYDHSYTFIGSYGTQCTEGQYFVDKHNEYVEEGQNNVLKYDTEATNYLKPMPKNLLVPREIPEGYYFLGLASNATFPKFYRESRKVDSSYDNSSPDKTYTTGLWTRFTAMVKGVDAEGQAAKKNLGIAIGDYDNKTVITGINIIGANGQKKEYIDLTNKVYNLNGQVVRSNSTDLKGLPAGVYVVKGKKFVVR